MAVAPAAAAAVVPALTPTAEQQAALAAFGTGADLVLQAGAGSGKTSTLRLLADSSSRRGLYLAYNKAIATEASSRFPRHVRCSTTHALAFQAIGHRYAGRLKAPRQRARDQARLLKLGPCHLGGGAEPLSPDQVARLVMRTVQRYCWSADPDPDQQHVPRVPGVDTPAARAELAQVLVAGARRAWQDLTNIDGALRFEHDHYLKMWQLSRPRLRAEVVLLDEAQDANPVIADVVSNQAHAQRVLVGDSAQAIYGWRGTVDAMGLFPEARKLSLSHSFRFGPVIADEANKWLQVLESPMRLTGHDGIASRVTRNVLAPVDAVLCRSNARAVSELVDAHARGVPACLVGGGGDIKQLAEAALELQETGRTSHPELCAFGSWGQVQDYAQHDGGGGDLKTFVSLIDSRGPAAVVDAIDRSVREDHAKLTISTAHKAKGREWARVRIADDFAPPRGDEVPRADAMLGYVAVTRARTLLVPDGLDWVDEYLPGPAEAADGEDARVAEDGGDGGDGPAAVFVPRQGGDPAVHPERSARELSEELYRLLVAENAARPGGGLLRCEELARALNAQLRGSDIAGVEPAAGSGGGLPER